MARRSRKARRRLPPRLPHVRQGRLPAPSLRERGQAGFAAAPVPVRGGAGRLILAGHKKSGATRVAPLSLSIPFYST